MVCSIFYPLMLLLLNLLLITEKTLKLQQEWLPVRCLVIHQVSTPRLAPRLFTLHILGLANTVRRIIRISYIGGTCLVGWLHILRLPSLSSKMTDRYKALGGLHFVETWYSCRGYSLHCCSSSGDRQARVWGPRRQVSIIMQWWQSNEPNINRVWRPSGKLPNRKPYFQGYIPTKQTRRA